MLAFQSLLLGIILLVVPVIVGTLFFPVDRRAASLPFAWISGQMLLWAGFQVITVPLVLQKGRFTQVVQFFGIYMAILVLVAGLLYMRRRRKGIAPSLRVVSGGKEAGKTEGGKAGCYLMWGIFAALLLFQVAQALFLAYGDGDDAYYVAVAGLAEESDTMYQKMAYNRGVTDLEVRYGLAPFPLWISFLARVTGMRTVAVAHTVVSPVLIVMAYAIFYLIGSRLLAKSRERIPLFMIFTELLVIFGGYSIYSAEKFMLTRSRQGKAALGNIMIPMLIFLLLLLLEKIQEEQKIAIGYWLLLCGTLTAACLCSTLGALLTCMLIAITGLCAAVSYRKWKFLFPLAACCFPCALVALLYVIF